MPNLAVPVVIAAAFTLGGWAILRAKARAEAIGHLLNVAFLLCALMAMLALLTTYADRYGRGRSQAAARPPAVGATLFGVRPAG